MTLVVRFKRLNESTKKNSHKKDRLWWKQVSRHQADGRKEEQSNWTASLWSSSGSGSSSSCSSSSSSSSSNVFLSSPVWEHFNGSIVSQGLQMRVYGICNVSRNCSSWSQWLEVILWCFQNCMIRHKIVRSYLGKAMFIYFIFDTLKNNSLQSTIQLHSDNILLITDYKNPKQQCCQ